MNKHRESEEKERKTKKFGLSSNNDRSICLEVFYEKDVLKNFEKFTGKWLCRNLILDDVPATQLVTLIKMKLRRMCFPLSFTKFLRTTFFMECLCCLFLSNVAKLKENNKHN